ncbi:hypothetical protein ACSFC1_00615 [Pseudothermotoga sp. U03pept]|uniref:hypothetical protein n=1 Tax=Pseudothermotoga sp. U03pept TaxID=3447012 RepID=UPI003F127BC0
MFFIKVTVFIVLALLFRKIWKEAIQRRKTLKARVQKSLQQAGWSCTSHFHYGGSWIATYKKTLQKQVVLVNENTLTFDELRKATLAALLSNINQVKIYYNQITPHTRKALHMLSKTHRTHRIRFTVQESI